MNNDEDDFVLHFQENEEVEVVELIDEDDQVQSFAILAQVELRECQFVMLSHVDDLDQDDGTELEVFLLERIKGEKNGFCAIEDEELFTEVRNLCVMMMSADNDTIGEA